MKLNTFIRRAPALYRSGRSVNLRGPIGRGKTETMCSLPARFAQMWGKRYGIVVVSGPLLNPPDAVGYLMPEHREEKGKSVLHSSFTKPFWYTLADGTTIDQYDGGIILVDEADKMDPDVKKVIGEAALSGRLGPHVIPKGNRDGKGQGTDGWLVWFAGNRMEDRSGSTKEFDHLITRQVQIELDDDLQSFEDWAFEHGVNPVIISFANQHSEILFEKLPAQQKPWCNPRSLVMLGNHMESLAGPDGALPVDDDMAEEAAGMIGAGAAAQLFAMIRLSYEMPKFEDIIKNPKKAAITKAPDAQMLVCYTLAAKVDKDTIGPAIEYIDRMPPEFAVSFGKASTRRDPNLIMAPAMGAWFKRNQTLLQAISAT